MSKLHFLLALFVTVVFLSPLPSEALSFTFRGFWGSNARCGISDDFGVDFSGCSKDDLNGDCIPDSDTIIRQAKSSFTDMGIDVVQFDVPIERFSIFGISICGNNCDNNGIDNTLSIGPDDFFDPLGKATFALEPDGYRIDFGSSIPRLLTLQLRVSSSNNIALRYEFNLARKLLTVFCNAPSTIIPPDAPISFTATATANRCVTTVITGFDCFTFTAKGKRIDKRESCEVSFIADDTITILDTDGVGDHITWNVTATDRSGNQRNAVCEILVVNPGKKP